MSFLAIVISVKIVVTFIFVCIPFLFFSQNFLEKFVPIGGESLGMFRLYGVAIASLLIGYTYGLVDELNGKYPYYAIVTGIFSNGGAALILMRHSLNSSLNMVSTIFFGCIAALLIFSLVHENIF